MTDAEHKERIMKAAQEFNLAVENAAVDAIQTEVECLMMDRPYMSVPFLVVEVLKKL